MSKPSSDRVTVSRAGTAPAPARDHLTLVLKGSGRDD